MTETRTQRGGFRGDEHREGSEPDADDRRPQLAETFERSVTEGRHRLGRTWPQLLATGTVGGMDVTLGVLALLVVEHETGSPLLGALAFSIGFIALTLANSELFTENFLVPVAAVAARRATVGALLRLWAGTAVTNLVGGYVLIGLVMAGLPELGPTAVKIARHYIELRPWPALAAGVVGGVVITLMTWMEHGSEEMVGKLAAAVSAAFLLVAGTLNHTVVVSILAFAALHAGAPFGYLHWLRTLGLATAGNAIGGLGLVTTLRLVQTGPQRRRHAEQRGQTQDGRR